MSHEIASRDAITGRILPISLRERLLSRLIIDPSGCLLWTGYIDRSGSGRISADGAPRLVHRLMWEMFEGPIPAGLQLDHVKARGCTNRHCASIAHLEPVTHLENNRRGMKATKTHCDNGHEYTPENTGRNHGRRRCLKCAWERNRRRRPAL